jgi:protein TonB
MATIVYNQSLEYGKMLRMIFSMPVAALITLLLFILMRFMILTEYTIPRVEAFTIPSINPIITDRDILKRETLPERTKAVDLPPPPPKIATENAQVPSETVAPLTLPALKIPTINTRDFAMVITDRKAQPIVRIEPIYPARALDQGRTGFCKARFAVSKTGRPLNINASCTDAVFVRAVERAISKWKYNPRIVDGVPVRLQGVATTFTFEITE